MSLPANLMDQCSPDDRQAVLKAAWIVAFSDGRLYAEKTKLKQIRKELDVESAAARQVEQEVRSGKASLTVPGTEAARRVMYHYALQMAVSDGKLTSEEQSIALRLGDAMGLSRKQIQAELDVLAPQEKNLKNKRAQQHPQSSADPQHATLRRLLVALGGQEFVDSPAVSFLLTRQSMLVVILTNLIPVFGVLFYDWRVFTIVFLYWLENILIGVFTIAKMITWSFHKKSLKDLLIIPFFAIPYGIFVAGHGAFVNVFFHKGPDRGPYEGFLSELTFGIAVALISLAIEHAYLFYTTFLRTGLYKRASAAGLMFAPFPRIVVLHVSIILGGLAIELFDSQSLALILLILIKFTVDLLELKFLEEMQLQPGDASENNLGLGIGMRIFLWSLCFVLLLIVGFGVHLALEQERQVKSYSATTAAVRIDRQRLNHSGEKRYTPIVKFQFEAQGRQFTTNTISPSNVMGELLFTDHFSPKALFERFEIGEETTVYYNPDNPAEACLIRRPSNLGYIFMLLPVIMVSGLVAFLWRSPKPGDVEFKRRKSKWIAALWHVVGVFSAVHYLNLAGADYGGGDLLMFGAYTQLGMIPVCYALPSTETSGFANRFNTAAVLSVIFTVVGLLLGFGVGLVATELFSASTTFYRHCIGYGMAIPAIVFFLIGFALKPGKPGKRKKNKSKRPKSSPSDQE